MLARDQQTGDQVLLHALELPELLVPGGPSAVDPDPAYGERIARLVSAVAEDTPDHPRLLRPVEAVTEEDLLWVAEERPPGRALAELTESGPLPPYRAAEIAADLAAALHALHRAGQAHGNVSPQSVLVCEDGAALLGGLLSGAAEEELCAALGGPRDAAPTPLQARRILDARSLLVGPGAERWALETGPAGDCWALGVLLYRMLTGRAPYPEDDLPVLLAAIRSGHPGPVDGCGPLAPLVERLLRPDPAARPGAAEVRRELAALIGGAPEPRGARPQAPQELPVRRPRGPLVRHPDAAVRRSRPDRAQTGRRSALPPALLGPLLVAGVLVLLVVVLVLVVSLAG
jgi:serine/threonine protein kinase